ncbi:ribbon-helix-helix protein, CopG family [Nakamurella endophytica]|uniref:Ribbon-helix-helix protein, CopG family n=1 Tax=Nakamurella endophytica TaxID=1748367 RepID=A0A917T3Z8_9ACTN|nr:ribbon-helix-helix protein, CopG family [Nakamurella endophytica]GGM09493.1 hypothetical protein GCM10011594_31700 [Nakamurella endophytica]
MTAVEPRPMATPDLAGLLSKRPKPQNRSSTPSTLAPEEAATNPLTEQPAVQQPAAQPTPNTAEPEARPPRTAPKTAVRRRPSRTVTGEVASLAAPEPVEPDDIESPTTTSRSYRRPLTFQLPRSVHRALREYTESRETTQTAVLFMAVNATHKEVREALRAEDAVADGELFKIPQTPKAEPTTEVKVRVTDAQLDALNQLARELGTNRSRVVTEAVRIYLGQ